MVIQSNCNFVTNATSPIESKSYKNAQGDVLSVQISGATGVYYIEGRLIHNGTWCPLAGINLSDFSPVKGAYTKPGIYELGIVGIRDIRARVEAVNGSVTIQGQIISTEET